MRQHEEEPKGLIAHRLGAPFDELGVDGVEQAGQQRHAIVELPPDEAPQRQDHETGNHHSPQHRGRFPIEAQTVQEQEDHGVDVQGHLMERRPQLAGLEIPRDLDIEHAVGADAGDS